MYTSAVELLKSKRSNFEKSMKRIAIGAGSAVLGLVLLHDGMIDVAGDLHHKRSSQEREEIRREDAVTRYAQANISERFSLLYVTGARTQVVELEGGSGLLGAMGTLANGGGSDGMQIGQYCLRGTPYDTRSSEERYDNATPAVINAAEDGGVTVHAVADGADPLKFIPQDGGILTPANASTQATMTAYGCEPPHL